MLLAVGGAGTRTETHWMTEVCEVLAVLCAGLFAGAAVYVSLVEHPARVSCGSRLAITEFGPSYKRGAAMQALLAALGSASGIGAWLAGASTIWLVGGLVLISVIPFTLVAIFPTNKQLLNPSLDKDSELAGQLLRRWGKLHAVRTVTGVAAFLIFVYSMF